MAWENSKEILWESDIKFFDTVHGRLSEELLEKINPDELHAILVRPVRDMLEYEEHIVYKPNGDMNVFYTYSLFPSNLTDGIPLLNAYGQKIYNDFIENMEENNA